MLDKYLFLQNIWLSVFNTLMAIGIRILTFPSLFQGRHEARRITHVIGNGPSLKKDMGRVLRSVGCDDCGFACVNMFVNSDEYEMFKPNMYFLADDIFFEDNLSEKCKETFSNIINKTKWTMDLVVPYSKRHAKSLKKLNNHPFITIRTLSTAPVVGGPISFNAFLYWVGIGTPLYQNVMIQAVFYSLKCGSREIHIWGADHNWMAERTVLEDNKMYMKCKHFDKDDELVPCREKVHNEMFSNARCLRIYHELALYAKWKQVKIYNNSSYSWIDAFERDMG